MSHNIVGKKSWQNMLVECKSLDNTYALLVMKLVVGFLQLMSVSNRILRTTNSTWPRTYLFETSIN